MPEHTFQVGDYVLTHRSATFPVKIVSVDQFSITYECSDGVRELVDATAYRSLAEQTAEWRIAQVLIDPTEANDWEARFILDLPATRAAGRVILHLGTISEVGAAP